MTIKHSREFSVGLDMKRIITVMVRRDLGQSNLGLSGNLAATLVIIKSVYFSQARPELTTFPIRSVHRQCQAWTIGQYSSAIVTSSCSKVSNSSSLNCSRLYGVNAKQTAVSWRYIAFTCWTRSAALGETSKEWFAVQRLELARQVNEHQVWNEDRAVGAAIQPKDWLDSAR